MIPIAAFIISLVALVISAIALTITYRKDAHFVRLELLPGAYGMSILGIVNDSAFDTSVRSIGFFRRRGGVTWLGASFGDNATDQFVDCPFQVKGRSTFEAHINTHRDISNFNGKVGFCVQLDTGRLFVLTRAVGWSLRMRMHLASLVSRLTGGRHSAGVPRPRVRLVR